MRWLDRLRAIEDSSHTSRTELPKPPKAPSGSFGSAYPLAYGKFSPITRRHPPATWDAADWRGYFDERVAVAMFDGQQPEAEARRIAWECCVIRWRDLNPAASDPSHCAHCGKPDEPGNIVPFGTDPHAWLHPGCWSAWDHAQREAAELALRAELIGETP